MRKADRAGRTAGKADADLFNAAPLPQAALTDRQRIACLRLIRSDSVGPVSFRELINNFGGAEEALQALPDLARRGGRDRPLRIFARDAAEAELEAARQVGARPLFTIEPGYPAALALVDVPPPLIYVRGRGDLFERTMIAIVGSRACSAGGQHLAETFARALGQEGFVIVSGLARGIDGSAHRGALDTGTVGVLGGGIDHVYPAEHAALYAAMSETGALISAQPPGFRPQGRDFRRRNTIIAGLAAGVLVVEAASRSGSLTTARIAGDFGREVMALPGHPLDPRAEGTNQLLKEGATLVTAPDDVIAALAPSLSRPVHLAEQAPAKLLPRGTAGAGPDTTVPADEVADTVLSALGPAPIGIDQLARATGLPLRLVRSALLELTLAGAIELHDGHMVTRRISA